jgi:hypothetical protein
VNAEFVRKTGNNRILLRAIGYIPAGTGWTHDSPNWHATLREQRMPLGLLRTKENGEMHD